MTFDIPGGIKNLLPGPLDSLRGPYATIDEACAAIQNVVVDGRNFREGKIVDIGIEPNTREYRWQGGFEDKNLKINTEATKYVKVPTGSQIFDLANDAIYVGKQLGDTGNLGDFPGTITARVKVNSTLGYLSVSGLVGVGITGPKYSRFIDSTFNYIPGTARVFATGANIIAIPTNADFFEFTYKLQSDPITAGNLVMVNYGQSALPYASYVGEKLASQFSGFELFAKGLLDFAHLLKAGNDPTSLTNVAKVIELIGSEMPEVEKVSFPTGTQIFSKTKHAVYPDTQIGSSGNITPGNQPGAITVRVPVNAANGFVTISGLVGVGVTGPKYRRFSDANGVSIAGSVVTLTAISTIQIPSNAAYIDFSAKLVNDPTTALDAIMINYGQSALPYASFLSVDLAGKIEGLDLAATRVVDGAKIDKPGSDLDSLTNIAQVIDLIKNTFAPTNLLLNDRWSNGLRVLDQAVDTRFTKGDGFSFNTLISYDLLDAYTEFGYQGKYVSANIGATPNFFFFVEARKLTADPNFTGNIWVNMEVKSSVTANFVFRALRVTGVSTETQLTQESISLVAGTITKVSFPAFSLLGNESSANVRGFELRILGSNAANISQVLKIGRIAVTTVQNTLVELGSDYSLALRFANLVSTLSDTDIIRVAFGGIKGKKWTQYGDSITAMNLWQGPVAAKFGLLSVNRGIGSTTVSENGFKAWVNADGSLNAVPTSSGGQSTTQPPNTIEIFSSMSNQERVNTIPLDSEIISIMASTNDFGRSIGLITDNTVNTFYGAYQLMLDRVYARCPNAEIVLATPVHRSGENTVPSNGVFFEEYRVAIRAIAKKYKYRLIEMSESGINENTKGLYLGDAVHPNQAGANRMAKVYIKEFGFLFA